MATTTIRHPRVTSGSNFPAIAVRSDLTVLPPRARRTITLLLTALLAGASLIGAASTSGSMTVTVQDGDDELPGALVTLESTRGGLFRSFVSDASGQTRFVGLAPGSYDITVSFTGFKTARYPGVALRAGQNRAIDVGLETRPIVDHVTVTSRSQFLETSIEPTGSAEWAGVENIGSINRIVLGDRRGGVTALPGTEGVTFGIGDRVLSDRFLIEVGATLAFGRRAVPYIKDFETHLATIRPRRRRRLRRLGDLAQRDLQLRRRRCWGLQRRASFRHRVAVDQPDRVPVTHIQRSGTSPETFRHPRWPDRLAVLGRQSSGERVRATEPRHPLLSTPARLLRQAVQPSRHDDRQLPSGLHPDPDVGRGISTRAT